MFGSYQQAIAILEDVKTKTKSELGKAVLDQAIFCIEQAIDHEEIQMLDEQKMLFKCNKCKELKPITDLRQFFLEEKKKELCAICIEDFRGFYL